MEAEGTSRTIDLKWVELERCTCLIQMDRGHGRGGLETNRTAAIPRRDPRANPIRDRFRVFFLNLDREISVSRESHQSWDTFEMERDTEVSDQEISAPEFDEPRGRRAPIDSFFRSLATQHGDGCAVILTGAGSDGTIGVKAIKEAGGIILVQDPREAEYPSMPRSAISTGLADFVLPVREIASQLIDLIKQKQHLSIEQLRPDDEEWLRRILAHVRVRTGNDFSKYKR